MNMLLLVIIQYVYIGAAIIYSVDTKGCACCLSDLQWTKLNKDNQRMFIHASMEKAKQTNCIPTKYM